MSNQVHCDWCAATLADDAIDAIHADIGNGHRIHFCGVLCMNACLAYSAALLSGRAVHPGHVPNTPQ